MPKPSNPDLHGYMFSDDMKFLQKVVVFHPHDPGKILILKRADHHKYRPGDWDFPGGNVLYGEDAIKSVTREVIEETGVGIQDLQPIQVYTDPHFDINTYLLVINYQAKALGDQIVVSKEHTEYRWATIDEFHSLCKTDFLKEILKYVR